VLTLRYTRQFTVCMGSFTYIDQVDRYGDFSCTPLDNYIYYSKPDLTVLPPTPKLVTDYCL